MAERKILIIEVEESILELLKLNLEENGYKVITVSNGIDGLRIARTEFPELIILDTVLPAMDGYDVCKEIRRDNVISYIPIIMISSQMDELSKILGLELGADDFLTKPFSIRELMARIKTALRRNTKNYECDLFEFGNIVIDFQKYEVLRDNKKIDLPLKEFELLNILVKNKGKVVAREFLEEKVWPFKNIRESRTLDVHIRHLRQKVENDDKNPRFIETIRGIGYRFNTFD